MDISYQLCKNNHYMITYLCYQRINSLSLINDWKFAVLLLVLQIADYFFLSCNHFCSCHTWKKIPQFDFLTFIYSQGGYYTVGIILNERTSLSQILTWIQFLDRVEGLLNFTYPLKPMTKTLPNCPAILMLKRKKKDLS